jgi:hypothetical protein
VWRARAIPGASPCFSGKQQSLPQKPVRPRLLGQKDVIPAGDGGIACSVRQHPQEKLWSISSTAPKRKKQTKQKANRGKWQGPYSPFMVEMIYRKEGWYMQIFLIYRVLLE